MTQDNFFRVDLLRSTPNPQSLIWFAAHNDYSPKYIVEEIEEGKFNHGEKWHGEKVIEKLLGSNRGHYGPLEHACLTIGAGYFPHCVISQLRTHRIASFDVQSFRYTGQQLVQLWEEYLDHNNYDKLFQDVEKFFYFRPCDSKYSYKKTGRYFYDKEWRDSHKRRAIEQLKGYYEDIKKGMSMEHARSYLIYDYRQHFVMTVNLRSAFHILDLRSKKDAQYEITEFSRLFLEALKGWRPIWSV